MMSITPNAIIRSASPRPYAGTQVALLPVRTRSTGSLQDSAFGGSWACGDHMSIEHNPTTATTFGSKRLDPGFLAGVLT